MNARSTRMGLVVVAASTVAALIGCEKTPMDVLIPNRPPRVAISAGPIRDSTDVFMVTFNWSAADDDGEVVSFRYAVDDTSTEDSWFETTDFELTLLFTAPDSSRIDSIRLVGTVPLERYIFNGAHTFFLKAVDDDGAESAPVLLSFTAETVAPETQITSPSSTRIVDLGTTFTVRWEGVDFDGTEDPVAFSWRLVPVANVINMTDEQIEETLFDRDAPGEPWSQFEPRTSVRLVNLEPGHYVFGVRALDQAGAVEPRMRTFRSPSLKNVLLIRASEEGGRPRIKVSSAVKQTDYPTADESRKTFQIPANSNVLFTWEGSAEDYGGAIAGYSWGLDLDDLADNNPGWSPEGPNQTQIRVNFSLPEGAPSEEHILFVRARDDVGGVRIADVNLIVVPLTFDRDVLYVDDWGRDSRGREYPDLGLRCTRAANGGQIPDGQVTTGDIPHDVCMDDFMREAMEAALDQLQLGDWIVDRYEPLDPVDGTFLRRGVEIDQLSHDYWVLNGPVTLQQLARYKVVIWNTRSFDTNELKRQNTEGEDNFLAIYLEAGGSVWLMGTGAYTRTLFGVRSVGLSPFGFKEDDFPFKFLKVQSVFEGAECTEGCFRTSGRTPRLQRENGFDGAYVVPSDMNPDWPDGRQRQWVADGFPPLIEVVREPYGSPAFGVESCDAMIMNRGFNVNARLHDAQLDTLYFYQSNFWRGLGRPPGHSWMDRGATGLRYSGPDQGRLIMFGFPLFYSAEDQVIDVLAAGIRWLIEE